jgi:ribosomal protein S18 acetylase RimI-like enzyme
VKEQARRQGIGRALVAAVARDAERRGRSFVWWVSRPWNTDAHTLYRAMGAIEEPVNAHAIVFDVFRSLSREAASGDEGKG